jgi:NADH dehydrogenase
MILVVGATGPLGLGREIARRLLAQGWPVRVLARSTSDPDVVNALKDLGAEVVEGDLREPWSLLPPCDGVDTVITTATAMTSTQPGTRSTPRISTGSGTSSMPPGPRSHPA